MRKDTLKGQVHLFLDDLIGQNVKTNFVEVDYILSQDVRTDFTDIEYLLSPPTPKPKVRGRLKNTKRSHSNSEWNQTQRWFMDGSCENYERVMGYCIPRAIKDETTGDLAREDYEDFFQDWLRDICRKDNLASELEDGGEIKMSVLYWWYRQYIHRATMKGAQNPLNRMRGARTQNEIDKGIKTTLHDPRHLAKQGVQVAQVHCKTDAETGLQVGETDYYYETQPMDVVEHDQLLDSVRRIIFDHYGEKGSERLALFSQMLEDVNNGGFKTKTEWAQSWGIPRATLNKRIASIQKAVQERL